MRSRKIHIGFVACLLPLFVGPPGSVRAQAPGAERQSVLVRFTWKLKGEFAPLFVALDKGYYAAEGLDVKFAEGSGAETVVKLIGT